MKKKILMSSLAIGVLFAGVASAASVWGTYKGNDIIRITADGNVVKSTDVPAISYNGRTMIPVSMLTAAGIYYTWDGPNKTVDIRKANQVDTNAVRAAPISWLKLYSTVTEDLRNMEDFSDNVEYLRQNSSTAMEQILENLDPSSQFNYYDSSKSDYEKLYNTLYSEVTSDIEVMVANNLDASVIKSSLSDLKSAYDNANKAHDSLVGYYKLGKNKNYSDDFFYYNTKALTQLRDLKKLIFNESTKYYDMIRNYK